MSSVLDIHQKMLDRVEALERIADRTDKSIQQVEERVAFSLSKHSLHTEEMVGAMEERVMMMLRGHKEEMQSSIDRAARETREMLSSVTEGRREELLERERFQQCVLQVLTPYTSSSLSLFQLSRHFLLHNRRHHH